MRKLVSRWITQGYRARRELAFLSARTCLSQTAATRSVRPSDCCARSNAASRELPCPLSDSAADPAARIIRRSASDFETAQRRASLSRSAVVSASSEYVALIFGMAIISRISPYSVVDQPDPYAVLHRPLPRTRVACALWPGTVAIGSPSPHLERRSSSPPPPPTGEAT
jgi:hypothetical protein